MARICAATFVASATIILMLKIAFPALILPNLWRFIAAVPCIFLMLILQFVALIAIRPNVTLRSDRLQKSHGQSGLLIKTADFVATQIYVHRDNRVRLKIRYRWRKRLRTLVVGVASTVDLNQLVAMLPVAPAIRDARSRSISARHSG